MKATPSKDQGVFRRHIRITVAACVILLVVAIAGDKTLRQRQLANRWSGHGPPAQTFNLTGVYSGDLDGMQVVFHFSDDDTYTADGNGVAGGFGSGTWSCEGQPPVCTLTDDEALANNLPANSEIKVENGSLYYVWFDGSGHYLLTPQ